MKQKRYLENLLHLCSDQRFGQDAIEWAIVCGHFTPTYDNLEADARRIFLPENSGSDVTVYDQICAGYRLHCQQNSDLQQAA